MNQSKFDQIIQIYNGVQKKILLVAEASMPEQQYRPFRKLVMDEFGHGGARDKVVDLFKNETKSTGQR